MHEEFYLHILKQHHEEMIREVELNHLAKTLRKRGGSRGGIGESLGRIMGFLGALRDPGVTGGGTRISALARHRRLWSREIGGCRTRAGRCRKAEW